MTSGEKFPRISAGNKHRNQEGRKKAEDFFICLLIHSLDCLFSQTGSSFFKTKSPKINYLPYGKT
nr:MAG TPA: hypothetical protein [Caudoviricetes sp.]